MASTGYKGLDVWQLAIQLAKLVYSFTARLPANEQFGLTSQIKRAVTSIPANIAEGYGRNMPASYAQFLKVAKGSLNELETHLILCGELGMAQADPRLFELISEIGSKLTNLINKVQGTAVRESVSEYVVFAEPNQF